MKPIEEELAGVIAILKRHLNPQGKKITWKEGEKEARNKLVYTLLINGFTTMRASQFIQDTFGISYKQAYKWIRQARDEAIPDVEEYKAKCLEIATERLTDIYNRAIKEGKLKDAIAAQCELNKIQGLQSQKVEIETNKPIEFTFG